MSAISTKIANTVPGLTVVEAANSFPPFSSQIRNITLHFQKTRGSYLTPVLQYATANSAHFYGIHRDEQMKKLSTGLDCIAATKNSYAEIKSQILQIMKLNPQTPIIQVVGDSAPYSVVGTNKTFDFLKAHIPRDAAILYGYTGHSPQDGTRCVNAATTDFITQHGLLNQTIGNLVGFHSPTALESWGCTGPDLKHYFLVYGDDESKRETGTVLGDDVTSSDYISDTLLVLEGGIQSFRQACNFLLLDKSIRGISDLRGDKTRVGIAQDGSKKGYFAATGFITFIKAKVSEANQDSIDVELLDAWFNDYLSTHLLADPKRNDYDTKKKLLDEAWSLFKSEKLYTKLSNFTLVRAR